MRTALVTGGAGFIGQHVVRRFLSEGFRVRILDDLSTGNADNVPANSELIRGSVLDADIVRQALLGVDVCVHLAAVASVESCIADYRTAHETNVTGLVNVFDVIRSGDLIPVVYASSAAVYGDAEDCPLSEGCPVRPISPYGADKYSCELHAYAAQVVFGIPNVGLRFFNVYGPGQNPTSPYSGVITKFQEGMKRGRVTLFGSGDQTRDFIHVDDVAQIVVQLAGSQTVGDTVLNVCTGAETSISRLLGLMVQASTLRPVIERLPKRSGDVQRSLGDPSALLAAVGEFEFRTVESGLADLGELVPST